MEMADPGHAALCCDGGCASAWVCNRGAGETSCAAGTLAASSWERRELHRPLDEPLPCDRAASMAPPPLCISFFVLALFWGVGTSFAATSAEHPCADSPALSELVAVESSAKTWPHVLDPSGLVLPGALAAEAEAESQLAWTSEVNVQMTKMMQPTSNDCPHLEQQAAPRRPLHLQLLHHIRVPPYPGAASMWTPRYPHSKSTRYPREERLSMAPVDPISSAPRRLVRRGF